MKKLLAAAAVFAVAFGLTWLIEFELVAQYTRTALLWALIACVLYFGYYVVKEI